MRGGDSLDCPRISTGEYNSRILSCPFLKSKNGPDKLVVIIYLGRKDSSDSTSRDQFSFAYVWRIYLSWTTCMPFAQRHFHASIAI